MSVYRSKSFDFFGSFSHTDNTAQCTGIKIPPRLQVNLAKGQFSFLCGCHFARDQTIDGAASPHLISYRKAINQLTTSTPE
jgi:hypothetical protein